MPTTATVSSNTTKISSRINKNQTRKTMGTIKTIAIIGCTLSLLICLFPVRQVEAGRLQDFIQNLVGNRDNNNSNSNNNSNNNNNNNGNSNSNSNSDSGSDSDTAATGDQNDQQLTPMMSAMNPFMRYPSFYFSPASYGAYPGMSFSNPMGAMSGLSPMTAMSSNSLGASFSPASFGPASFGSFGSTPSANPMSAFGTTSGMSASSLSNIYANSPSLMGGYAPYYGRR